MNIRMTPPVASTMTTMTPARIPGTAAPAPGNVDAGSSTAMKPAPGRIPHIGSPGVADALSSDEQLFFERMFSSEARTVTSAGYRREGNTTSPMIGTVIDRRG